MANVILPPGEQQFSDENGKPYVAGLVYFYIPNTLTPKDTYQDADGTILNTNPVVLDSAGRAVIWGEGEYRQMLYDRYGNSIWDKIVSYKSPTSASNITITDAGVYYASNNVEGALQEVGHDTNLTGNNLTPVPSWDDVPELGSSAINAPAQALLNRTEALRDNSPAFGASLIGADNGGTIADAITPPTILRARSLVKMLPRSMWADITSGAAAMDHTAAIAAALADPSIGSFIELPKGVLNIDRFHVPAGCPIKHFVFGECELRQRSDWSAGLGHFVRWLRSADTYGYVDDIIVEGGLINQNNKYMGGSLFFAALTQHMRIIDTTIKHRDANITQVTLNPSTDVFSAAGHPFQNGDRTTLSAGTTEPTGALTSGSIYYVVNRTTNTFQLSATLGGSPIDFTDAGAGTLYVSYTGSWAFNVGGRDLRLVRTKVLNGLGRFQDGHHITHGDDIGLDHCHSESGDDAYAFGTETGDFDDLANVSADGCYGKSNWASLFKVYVNDPARSVKSIYANGMFGRGGIMDGGSVFIQDNTSIPTGSDPRTGTPKIERIRADVEVHTGDSSRINLNSARHVWVHAAADVKIRGSFSEAGGAVTIQDYLISRSRDVTVEMRKVGMLPSNIVPGVLGSSTDYANINCTVDIERAKTFAQSPNMEGATEGVVGLTSGVGPTGWNYPVATSSGVNRYNVLPGSIGGKQALGMRLTGTSSGSAQWSFGPNASNEVVATQGQTRRFRVKLALLGGTLTNLTVALFLDERDASGTFIASTNVDVTKKIVNCFAQFEVVRTVANATATRVFGRIVITQASSGSVEATIGVLSPEVE